MPASIGSNAELVAEQVVALLVPPLEKASVVLAAGPRVFDDAFLTGDRTGLQECPAFFGGR